MTDSEKKNADDAQDDKAVAKKDSASPSVQHRNSAFGQTLIPPTSDATTGDVATTDPKISAGADSSPDRESESRVQIGRFKVTRLLGRGAFGAVYLADDPQLARKVAIKVARSGVLNSGEEIRRFFREGRAAARLRHPNIVPVYEIGSSRGTNYIVTEFVPGQTLGDLLNQRKKLSPQEAVPLIRQIADALDYAHAQGVIHRDIKPENILLDEQGQLHIADFGLARHADDITHTADGAIMGTPAYMSPEQADGHANTADGRTDIWSVGIIFNQMLTGRRPFSGTVTQVLVDIKEREVIPLRQIDRSIPADLETICGKCLQKNPYERFQNAGEVDEELARWQRGEPIRSRPISTFARVVRLSKRNPLVASLIAAVCGSLLLGTIVSVLFAIDAANKTQIARREEQNARREQQNARTEEQNARREQRQRLVDQVSRIRDAKSASVPAVIDAIEVFMDQVEDNEAVKTELWRQLEASVDRPEHSARFRMAILRLDHEKAVSRGIVTLLVDDLCRANGPEFLNLRSGLQNETTMDLEMLWAKISSRDQDRAHRFRSAAALALFDPQNPAWTTMGVAEEVTSQLLSQNTLELSAWIDAIRPIRQHIYPYLRHAMTESQSTVRQPAVVCSAALFADQPAKLIELLERSDEQQFQVLVQAFRDNRRSHAELAQRTAIVLTSKEAESIVAKVNLSLAMIEINRSDSVVNLFASAEDESLRTALIHRAGPSHVNWRFFAELFDHDDADVIAAALLALGEYSLNALSPNDRTSLLPRVTALFESHTATSVHSAADWLLRTWNLESEVVPGNTAQRETIVTRTSESGARDWSVNSLGITMARVVATTECELGSLPGETDRPDFRELGLPDLERRRKWKIPRNFEISTREITVADFLVFVKDTGRTDFQYDKRYAPNQTCPINSVTWYQAAAFCSWLSQKEGLPLCYPAPDKVGPAMDLADDLLKRTGYRLPTAAEWEFACRAGTTTPRHFGQSDRWMNKYAWSELNAGEVSHPVGRLKPNRLGLFDMHGNVTEWCHTWWFEEAWDVATSKRVEVLTDESDPRRGYLKEYRGGAFTDKPRAIRSAHRGGRDEEECGWEPHFVFESLGFRIVRTIPGDDISKKPPTN